MRPGRSQLAFVLLLALAGARLSAGPVLAPGARLFVMRTERFDIIFPEASRPSALHLAAVADSVYAEVAGALEAGGQGRIPVLISPDIGSFNGYTSPVPYMHIVLYDTSAELDWTSLEDNFRALFTHELAHAVSLRVRAPWADFLGGIFGSWVLPGLLNSPAFMVEGAAVSFESADGATGRANDPAVKERLRQDILENRFKSPIEASAAYDEYPGGQIYYEYGGLFSAYLQKTYGMEAYARLWKAMGDLVLHLSLDPYGVGFYRAFEEVYGLPFLKAWAGFRASLELGPLPDPPEPLWPLEGRAQAAFSGPLAASEGALFWVDGRSRRAYGLELGGGKPAALFDADPSCAIGDASPDAAPGSRDGAPRGRLLVSRALDLPDGRDRVETLEYDLASGRFLPETAVPSMREARFFRGGIVGIVSNLHNTDLVFAPAADRPERRRLLAGTERLMFGSPAVLDDSRIALIVSVSGKRSIGLLDVDSGLLSLLRAPEEGLLDWVRGLSASGGRLSFSYDSGEGLYKLGRVEGLGPGESPSLRLERADRSGGVFSPVEAGGSIYYLARLSEGERLCRYPRGAEGPGPGGPALEALPCRLEPFDPAPLAAAREGEANEVAQRVEARPYSPLAYAKPFDMWFLYPDPTAIGRSFRLFGLFVLRDPAGSNTLFLNLGYDAARPFAELGLDWANAELPVSFIASARDGLLYPASGEVYRQSSASLEADLALPLFPRPRRLVLALGGAALARAVMPGAAGEDDSPYTWPWSGYGAAASALLGWRGRLPGAEPDTSRGLDLLSYQDLSLASGVYKAEAELRASWDSPGLELELWGAWASLPILRLDSTSPVFSGDRRPAYVEYAGLVTGSFGLLAEAEASANLANQAIHANLLGLYYNRLLLDSGLRAAYLSGGEAGPEGDWLSSAFLRLSLDTTAPFGPTALAARTWVEASLRLDGSPLAEAWGLGFGLSLDSSSLLAADRLYRGTAMQILH